MVIFPWRSREFPVCFPLNQSIDISLWRNEAFKPENHPWHSWFHSVSLIFQRRWIWWMAESKCSFAGGELMLALVSWIITVPGKTMNNSTFPPEKFRRSYCWKRVAWRVFASWVRAAKKSCVALSFWLPEAVWDVKNGETMTQLNIKRFMDFTELCMVILGLLIIHGYTRFMEYMCLYCR